MQARLSGAEWKPYRQPERLCTSCDETPRNRKEALELLAVAGDDCLDEALRAVEKYANEDLPAAYLTRFERTGDPMDLLHMWNTGDHFNRALALERLGLTREATQAWDDVVKEGSDWANEARDHRARLMAQAYQWNQEAVTAALQRRDRAALTKIATAFPSTAARYFERFALSDPEGARLLATVLATAGERYPQAVVDAMERSRDHEALQEGIAALRDGKFESAAALLERAGNPLHLAARSHVAADRLRTAEESLSLLDAIVPHLKPEYRELSSRIHTSRANALELQTEYLQAHAAYENALASANSEPTSIADALSRRAQNHVIIGNAEAAFRDAYRALSQLNRVGATNARHQTYAAAAMATRELGYPLLALFYQNAAVEVAQQAVADSRNPTFAKLHLAVSLRARADIHVELAHDDDAEADLKLASELADAAAKPELRAQLQMRIHEVRGQALSQKRPAEAIAELTRAIELAKKQDSTYRAVLHFKRAEARRNNGDAAADDDLAEALGIIREEGKRLVDARQRGAYEELWNSYFSRFQTMQHRMIESRIGAGDLDGAFVYAETARALEPMQILLQAQAAPADFRPIESKADLRRHLNDIPDDTAILHYVVLPEKTYTWVLTRGKIDGPLAQRVTEAQIHERVLQALGAVQSGQRDPFTVAMRAAYGELFREPLKRVPESKTRIVIVPDEPMYGLPFNGLQGTKAEGYLIERGPISVAGSTSLYLYALARDREFRARQTPSVLLVSDPAVGRRVDYPPLPNAKAEVEELARDHYRGAAVLADTEATAAAFMEHAKNATIIHFAGHAVANPQKPSQSRLLLAPDKNESGELTAERLMKGLSELDRTRLVVLGACSTAGGATVGPQGLAPLVRPLIAANVPAVVGSLWDVGDATTKELLVSLHCHYRHGDDVAEALRQAQLERLRKQKPAMRWAAFQAVGYAASPWARPTALEDPSSVCTQNSLHGPDGLRHQ